MQEKKRPTYKQLTENCAALEEQIKVLVQTEVQLRRTKAELNRSKKKIEEYNKTLERKVEERTQELRNSTEKLQHEIAEREKTEHELRIVEESLKRSERMEAIGLLAENVAHDLNNFLTCIIEYPKLIARRMPDDDTTRKHLDAISSCGEKAAGIVHDLSKLTQREKVATELVNLNDIIRTTINSSEFVRKKNGYPDVVITTRLHSSLLNMYGSPVYIYNAVINLIVNSLESMTKGGVLTISTDNEYVDISKNCYEQIGQGEYVTLTIADTGTGIPGKHLDRIFEPFYSRKFLKRRGTGLGMAIVWGTVKEHKGFIDIKSVEGSGTTITLYFPASRKMVVKRAMPSNTEVLRGGNESILIIDDVDFQREICSEIVAELGYSPATVASGEDAVAWLKGRCADLLILDMVMDPGMNGLETYRKIRTILPGQKAIIVSGYSNPKHIQETQRLGAGAFVKKPYTIESLGKAIKTELARKT